MMGFAKREEGGGGGEAEIRFLLGLALRHLRDDDLTLRWGVADLARRRLIARALFISSEHSLSVESELSVPTLITSNG